MHPMLALTLGMVGAVAMVRWCVREVRRVSSELDGIPAHMGQETIDRNTLPKLKRDPATGEYRPG